MVEQNQVHRQNGVALWRQIADRIRASISNGDYDRTGMVPPEVVLAEQFGVNRHTVRSALAALSHEGIVTAVQGRGTLISRKERLTFPISKRTRFIEGIGDQVREMQGLLLSSAIEDPGAEVARQLKLASGDKVLRMDALRKADQRPVSRSTSWFPVPRFQGIDDAFRESGSITAAFAKVGLSDYLRAHTEITAIHAEASDLADLALSPGAILLVTRALNIDRDGKPVQYGVSRFSADVVQFTVEN